MSNNYIKIIFNMPDRQVFTRLQKDLINDDVEIIHFPSLSETDQFFKNVKPDILVSQVDPSLIADPEIVDFFHLPVLRDTWIIFILSSRLSLEQMQSLGEFRNSIILSENTASDTITYNLKSVINQVRLASNQTITQQFVENLLKCSKILFDESALTDGLESLINFLPKIFPYDYWAYFIYDSEFSRVTNFFQFIPPHKRNSAVLTQNLEKLSKEWLEQGNNVQTVQEQSPQLFKKFSDWGWRISQVYFQPLIFNGLQLGGMIIGNIKPKEFSNNNIKFFNDLGLLVSQRIYRFLNYIKEEKTLDNFAEQLILNRFSQDSILQLSCKKINETVRADNTIFWQINRGFGFLFPYFYYELESSTDWRSMEKNIIYLNKDKNLDSLISHKDISTVENVSKNNMFGEATLTTFKKLGYHNLIIAPVRIQHEDIGMFVVNRGIQKKSFNPWEVSRVESLLNKIQTVLEDTYVIKESKFKLKQLSRIFELGNDIKLDLNLEDILVHITNSIRKTLGWNDVAVLASNQFRKTYRLVSKVGFDRKETFPLEFLNSVSFRDFEKFIRKCKKISHSYFYDSQSLQQKRKQDKEGQIPEDVQTEWSDQDLVVVPIETRMKKLGILVVHDPVDRLKPGRDKVVSLEYFANQAAVAIDNSVLYENLLASEERYRSLAETMTLSLVTCSLESKILYVNPAFQKLVGLEKKKLSKKLITNFFSSESQSKLEEILDIVLRTSSEDRANVENIELELISTSGEAIPVSTFAFSFYQQRQKIGFFLVLNDLRVVKRLERLKSDFNSMIVHDLRSPMNVIQGFIELIRTRVVGEINSEQEELLDIAKENVKKVLTLIDNFLVASKIEIGKFSIEPKVSEINSLVQRVADHHKVLTDSKNIKLDVELNPNLPLLYFDSLRIEQVLNNLMSNAIKFTSEGDKIWITSNLYEKELKGEEKKFAMITVHDTGSGIADNQLKNVFEKYEQVDSAVVTKSAGTGLGLSICQEIVHLHGGEIWAESVLNKGSHFSFTLPIEPSIDKVLKSDD